MRPAFSLLLMTCLLAPTASWASNKPDSSAKAPPQKPPEKPRPKPSAKERQEALQLLLKPDVVYGLMCGLHNFTLMPEVRAISTLRRAGDLPALYRLMAHGTPEAKIYALEALDKLGKLRPWDRKVWRDMVRQDIPITTCGGCIQRTVPISKIGLLDEFRKKGQA